MMKSVSKLIYTLNNSRVSTLELVSLATLRAKHAFGAALRILIPTFQLKLVYKPVGLIAITIFLSACQPDAFQSPITGRKYDKFSKFEHGNHKIGIPYKIFDQFYYPKADSSYDKTGIASWYGPNFHGRTTANGDMYNQYEMTAAHPTLPMPSVVEVTNLRNNKKVRLVVNDRGPFIDNRIIDVSKQAAKKLGFYVKGTEKVRVKILRQETERLWQKDGFEIAWADIKKNAPKNYQLASKPTPPANHNVSSLKNSNNITTAKAKTQLTEKANNKTKLNESTDEQIYIQLGAFSNINSANKLKQLLLPKQYNIEIAKEEHLYCVRLGPYPDRNAAQNKIDTLENEGHKNPFIIAMNN